jgi:murein DD-endopeptidase MepM/ murein hydrolase activator NlpD
MTRYRLATLLFVLASLAGCTDADDSDYPYDPVHAPGGRPGYQILAAPGDTIDGLARRFETSREALIEANQLRPPYAIRPYQTILIPPPATYRVRPDDTVVGISTMLGVDEEALARANGLSRPYHMRVGQILTVPGGIGGGAGPAGPPAEADAYAEDRGPGGPPVGEAPRPRSSISAQPLPPPPGAAASGGGGFGGGAPAPQPAYPPPNSGQTSGLASPPHNLTPPAYAQEAQAAPPRRELASDAPTPLVPAAPASASARLEPPQSPGAAPHFIKPVSGPVIEGFGAHDGGQKNDGINIAAAAGAAVHAAAAGTVIYTGNELAAFGNLVLVRHADGWVTAYGHLGSIAVKRYDAVALGQTIGVVGQTGSVTSPQLHFEIRQGSKPVDPAPYLGG